MGLRVPANCSSITFTVSGVKAPVARIISGLTANEETLLGGPGNPQNQVVLVTTGALGVTTIKFPVGIITSITINAVPYAVNAVTGFITGVPAADATAFLGATRNQPFECAAA